MLTHVIVSSGMRMGDRRRAYLPIGRGTCGSCGLVVYPPDGNRNRLHRVDICHRERLKTQLGLGNLVHPDVCEHALAHVSGRVLNVVLNDVIRGNT